MDPASSEMPVPDLHVRSTRSSTIIVHRVTPGNNEVFLAWQRGITNAAQGFLGYQETEVYPPATGSSQEWVIIIHFDSAKNLQNWLDSPQRAEWTAKLPREMQDFRLKTLPSGFAAWFAGLADEGASLPHWKVFMMVLFGLYPTVMLLTWFLSPHTQRFGLATAIFLGNVASCAFLEWLGSPVIRLVFGPWLRARGQEGRVRNVVGTVLIVATLLAMVVVFHLIAS